MIRYRLYQFGLLLTFLLAACIPAGNQEIEMRDAWARPGLIGGNSAIFLVIEVHGEEDALLGASSPVTEVVEIHRTSMQDGVMRMEPQQFVPLPQGKTEFKPGGLHIMLIGLKRELQVGDTFEVSLEYELAGALPLMVTVREQ